MSGSAGSRLLSLLLAICATIAGAGCATIRTTDPPRTATEEFLMSVAATRAVEQLSAESLRDRRVFVDTTYLGAAQTNAQTSFLIAETRAKLLLAGVRLAADRAQAEIVLELRSGALSIDRLEYLLGIPSIALPTTGTDAGAGVPVLTPELAIVKNLKQTGYSSVAYVAYWADTGEVVAASGPFIGRTLREDWWFFGFGPRTVGTIPPAEAED